MIFLSRTKLDVYESTFCDFDKRAFSFTKLRIIFMYFCISKVGQLTSEVTQYFAIQHIICFN